MLRKAPVKSISLHRGPFMYEGKLDSGGLGLVWQGPVGGEKGDVIEAGLVYSGDTFFTFVMNEQCTYGI